MAIFLGPNPSDHVHVDTMKVRSPALFRGWQCTCTTTLWWYWYCLWWERRKYYLPTSYNACDVVFDENFWLAPWIMKTFSWRVAFRPLWLVITNLWPNVTSIFPPTNDDVCTGVSCADDLSGERLRAGRRIGRHRHLLRSNIVINIIRLMAASQ